MSELAGQVEQAETRLSEVVERRNLLRTRDSRAEALGILSEKSSFLDSDLENIFERWEERVTTTELSSECGLGTDDPLAHELTKDEELLDLRSELSEMLADEKPLEYNGT
jgi:phage shock protein A